ncbi:MAG: DUF551 domain-containing protein [Clostridia bacterium]|nr:DUF551 domain-containing protein [Clostridia bacterium]
MDVVKVRTCKGSNCIEIQMDWQYEDEKYTSVIAVPLEHFRKADMWFIVRMMLDAAENKSKEKEKKLTWISVNDRLPERKQDVLMYFDTGNMAVGFWYTGDETITFWSAYTDDGMYADCDCEPLYWMPLPEPPKEAE